MPSFDVHEYIKNLSQELVLAYGASKQITTAGTKGDAREDAVREKLGLLLPAGAGVGSGFVIDSDGNASAQIDLIIYETQYCPIFAVGTAKYYPCEAVIAAGEIKSVIGKTELHDIYRKIASVRKLNKFPRLPRRPHRENEIHYRRYLSKEVASMQGDYRTIQNSSSVAQIYGFGFGRSFGAKPKTMINHTVELFDAFESEHRPNLVLTLDQLAIVPSEGSQVSYTALNRSGATFVEFENSLEHLLAALLVKIENGITSPGDVYEIYVPPSPFRILESRAAG